MKRIFQAETFTTSETIGGQWHNDNHDWIDYAKVENNTDSLETIKGFVWSVVEREHWYNLVCKK